MKTLLLLVCLLFWINSFAQIEFGIYEDQQEIVAIMPDGTAYTSCKSCLINDTSYTKWIKNSDDSFKLENSGHIWSYDNNSMTIKNSITSSTVVLKQSLYKSGKLRLSTNWEVKDGYKYVKSGIWIEYFENGKTKFISHFSDNLLNGEKLEFDSTGVIICCENYKNGMLHGLRTEYYNNGNKKCQIQFVDGIENGKCEYYYKNEFICLTGQYKNGKKQGKWIATSPNRLTNTEIMYKNDIITNVNDVSANIKWITFTSQEDLFNKIKEQ